MTEPGQVQPTRTLDKILVIGHPYVDKRDLVLKYVHGKTPPIYTYSAHTENQIIRVLDTNVQVTLDELKGTGCVGLGDMTTEIDQWMYYPNTSVFVVCFDTEDRETFEEVQERWIPEIKYFYGGKPNGTYSGRYERGDWIRKSCMKREGRRRRRMPPFLLLGIKQKGWNSGRAGEPVTFEEGKRVASQFGAEMYLECSLEAGEGIDLVFQNAVRVALIAEDTSEEDQSRWKRCIAWVSDRWRALVGAG